MKVTNHKNCYCHTCSKSFHYLGIARHRTMHKEKRQDCRIQYTNGDVYRHTYSDLPKVEKLITKYRELADVWNGKCLQTENKMQDIAGELEDYGINVEDFD